MRDIYKLLPAAPAAKYITNDEYRRTKTALTRAENSGDPLKVLGAVETALEVWKGKAWPDEWSRWRRALEDAYEARVRADDDMLHGEQLRWRNAAYVLCQ